MAEILAAWCGHRGLAWWCSASANQASYYTAEVSPCFYFLYFCMSENMVLCGTDPGVQVVRSVSPGCIHYTSLGDERAGQPGIAG